MARTIHAVMASTTCVPSPRLRYSGAVCNAAMVTAVRRESKSHMRRVRPAYLTILMCQCPCCQLLRVTARINDGCRQVGSFDQVFSWEFDLVRVYDLGYELCRSARCSMARRSYVREGLACCRSRSSTFRIRNPAGSVVRCTCASLTLILLAAFVHGPS